MGAGGGAGLAAGLCSGGLATDDTGAEEEGEGSQLLPGDQAGLPVKI